jgi:hypothetical protein
MFLEESGLYLSGLFSSQNAYHFDQLRIQFPVIICLEFAAASGVGNAQSRSLFQANQPPNQACPIKGNVTSKGDRIYHKPGDRDYDRVVMQNFDHDMCAKGKRRFCSAAEAEAAGWRHVLR